MYFENFTELIAMEGHGTYVWTVYILATLVCAALIVGLRLKKRRLVNDLDSQLRREETI
mgnify:CR=1 FL=1